MKKLLTLVLGFTTFAVMPFAMATTSSAETSQPAVALNSAFNYAVVNLNYIMAKSKAIDSINSQLKAYETKLQNMVKQKKQELQQEQQKLQEKRATLSPQAFQAAATAFQQKVVQSEKNLQDQAQSLQKVRIDAFAVVEKSLGTIVAEEASKKGYEIVFSASTLATYPKTHDISEAVLSTLNKNLTKVKVNYPFTK